MVDKDGFPAIYALNCNCSADSFAGEASTTERPRCHSYHRRQGQLGLCSIDLAPLNLKGYFQARIDGSYQHNSHNCQVFCLQTTAIWIGIRLGSDVLSSRLIPIVPHLILLLNYPGIISRHTNTVLHHRPDCGSTAADCKLRNSGVSASFHSSRRSNMARSLANQTPSIAKAWIFSTDSGTLNLVSPVLNSTAQSIIYSLGNIEFAT